MPDLGVLATRDENGQFGVAIGSRLDRELERGAWHPAVGAFDDVERESGEAEITPRLDQLTRPPRVEIEMHRAQIVRLQCACVLDGAGGSDVEVVDQHHDRVQAHGVRLGQCLGVFVKLDVLGVVRAIEPHDAVDHHRHEHDDDPRPIVELHDGDDQEHQQRQQCADAIDHQPALPRWLLVGEVVLRHAGTAEGEAREHADCVERDQSADLSTGGEQGRDGCGGEEDDAVGEHQPMAADGELAVPRAARRTPSSTMAYDLPTPGAAPRYTRSRPRAIPLDAPTFAFGCSPTRRAGRLSGGTTVGWSDRGRSNRAVRTARPTPMACRPAPARPCSRAGAHVNWD